MRFRISKLLWLYCFNFVIWTKYFRQMLITFKFFDVQFVPNARTWHIGLLEKSNTLFWKFLMNLEKSRNLRFFWRNCHLQKMQAQSEPIAPQGWRSPWGHNIRCIINLEVKRFLGVELLQILEFGAKTVFFCCVRYAPTDPK